VSIAGHAAVIREPGGPEVLLYEPITVGSPGPGELRLRQTAIGVNYHDVYVRSGMYRTLALPGIPGIEAAGVVEEVGEGVTTFSIGDRVTYFSGQYGTYASDRLLPAAIAVRLPDEVDDQLAASAFLKGMTAQALVKQVHRVQPGETVLVQAAAGGVGQILCQWATHLGASVIGTVGSPEKAKLAEAAGCAHVILYRDQDFVAGVRQITQGRGVDVVYDAVGADTFLGSIDCLALRGHLVNFGQSSGPVAPLDMARLFAKSNSLSRPNVAHYAHSRADLDTMATDLFASLKGGIIKPAAGTVLPLAQAGRAHAMLEGRETSAGIILIP
jgi:NADPH2:quinone reductase